MNEPNKSGMSSSMKRAPQNDNCLLLFPQHKNSRVLRWSHIWWFGISSQPTQDRLLLAKSKSKSEPRRLEVADRPFVKDFIHFYFQFNELASILSCSNNIHVWKWTTEVGDRRFVKTSVFTKSTKESSSSVTKITMECLPFRAARGFESSKLWVLQRKITPWKFVLNYLCHSVWWFNERDIHSAKSWIMTVYTVQYIIIMIFLHCPRVRVRIRN